MQFLTNLLGGSDNTYLTMALALGIVLVLIVLGLWVLKLLTRATNSVAGGRNRRLGVVETLPLDPKRQLVIVRRDNVEHMLLIGGPQDVIVETGIEPVARPAKPAQPTPPRMERARPVHTENAPFGGERPPVVPEAVSRPSAQIRNFSRPVEQRRTSLRHTALLRPVSTLDPGVVRLSPEKSTGPAGDSARSDPPGRDRGPGGASGGTYSSDQEHWRN